MFGGVGVLLNGNIFLGICEDFPLVRLSGRGGQGCVEEECTKEFDITSKSMKGWAMVYSQGLEEDGELKKWFESSLEFVRTSHAK